MKAGIVMKLIVNGDSHAAGAEAANTFAFAEDDSQYFYLGRSPHPDNKRVAWSTRLAASLRASLFLEAESASSNARIMRTTREFLNRVDSTGSLVIVQWSTWERQEWLIDGVYYQINASGIDDVPESHQEQYKEFVRTVDWHQCTKQAHQEIYQFHQELVNQNIEHVFFNGDTSFAAIPESERLDWGHHYMSPYDADGTYSAVLRNNGYETVSRKSYHFGAESHRFWSRYMLQYIKEHNLLG